MVFALFTVYVIQCCFVSGYDETLPVSRYVTILPKAKYRDGRIVIIIACARELLLLRAGIVRDNARIIAILTGCRFLSRFVSLYSIYTYSCACLSPFKFPFNWKQFTFLLTSPCIPNILMSSKQHILNPGSLQVTHICFVCMLLTLGN